MNNLKINETPVRTSKSFNINNIKINEDMLPKDISDFNNVEIINNSSKVFIDNNKTPINLKYGLGEELVSEIKNKSNQNFKIAVDSKINTETIINFNFDKTNNSLVENIDITANEDTISTIIIKYESIKDLECYHNGIIKINAKSNSQINIIVLNLLSDLSNNFLTMDNKIEKSAKVEYTIVDFGGQNTVTNYYSNILGDFAENNLNTIYIGKEKQVIDLNYIAELYGKK